MRRSTVGDEVRGVKRLVRALRPASLLPLVRLPRCVVRVVPRPLLVRVDVPPERPTRPRCPLVARPVERPVCVRAPCVERPTVPREDDAAREGVPRLWTVRVRAVVLLRPIVLDPSPPRAIVRAERVSTVLRPMVPPRGW